MPQNPGNDTVTFNYPGVVNDRLHKVTAVNASTFTQTGCHMQPLTVKDKISDTVYAEATDKCIAPANANTSTVQAEWLLVSNGLTYRVVGVKPYRDRWGRLDHITFHARQEMV